MPYEFTIGGGEMTPTMKLKRGFVEKKHADVIAELYMDPKV